jgi:hypothetical protein
MEPMMLLEIVPLPVWFIPLLRMLSVEPLKVSSMFPFEVVLPIVLPVTVPIFTEPASAEIPTKYPAPEVVGLEVKLMLEIVLPLTVEVVVEPTEEKRIQYKECEAFPPKVSGVPPQFGDVPPIKLFEITIPFATEELTSIIVRFEAEAGLLVTV